MPKKSKSQSKSQQKREKTQKEEKSPIELLKEGVERAKRGLRGEDPDLRKKT